MTSGTISFTKPLCLEQSYNIIFPRFPHIRRVLNDLEDLLSPRYQPPTLLPIPDEFNPQAPRIMFLSKMGHSKIIFSQENVVLNVRYTKDWGEDIAKGRDYLQERIAILIQITNTIFGSGPLFQGLTTNMFLGTECTEEEIIRFLSDRLLKNNDGKRLHEISLKISEIIDDKYFSNITYQYIRFWSQGQNEVILPLSKNNAIARGIQIIGDYNDRFSFNEYPDYSSPPDIWKTLITEGIGKVFSETEHLISYDTI